jgi:ABC-type multidrug transport system fused ATPase/permease subunit
MLFGMIFGALVTLVVVFCYIITISFTVWMIVDAGKQDRFWWLTFIIGVPIIGPAVYYFTEKKHEYIKAPIHHLHESETEEQHERAPRKKISRKAKTQIEYKKEVSDLKEETTQKLEEGQVTQEIINEVETKQG